MKIRQATHEDARLLFELGAKTFYDTFARDNAPKNMEKYLRENFSLEIQSEELSRSDNLFLIAETDGLPVGYAQLIVNSRDETVTGDKPVELRRIYVVQEYIGTGLGRELMRNCIDAARAQGAAVLWLGVWERNEKAIAFYKKMGFREAGSHAFQLGDEVQTDLILELAII